MQIKTGRNINFSQIQPSRPLFGNKPKSKTSVNYINRVHENFRDKNIGEPAIVENYPKSY